DPRAFPKRACVGTYRPRPGACPGCLLRKPPDGIDRRPQALAGLVPASGSFEGAQWFIAGWSSPVARQAHNLKVTGSNPVPATTDTNTPVAKAAGVFCVWRYAGDVRSGDTNRGAP